MVTLNGTWLLFLLTYPWATSRTRRTNTGSQPITVKTSVLKERGEGGKRHVVLILQVAETLASPGIAFAIKTSRGVASSCPDSTYKDVAFSPAPSTLVAATDIVPHRPAVDAKNSGGHETRRPSSSIAAPKVATTMKARRPDRACRSAPRPSSAPSTSCPRSPNKPANSIPSTSCICSSRSSPKTRGWYLCSSPE